jgi:ABC-type uncharacterized transport system ATPase subunit/ABC-type uncharacterized transport system permease subunit
MTNDPSLGIHTDLGPEQSPHLVRMVGIVKHFPGVVANDHITFELRPGEVHGLLGENGAGKSTLMNVLYGLYHPDAGEIFVRDKPVELHSPADAIANGVGMVHQSFRQIPNLSVAENVVLGLPSDGVLLDLKAVSKRIADISERYGLNIDPKAPLWQLSAGQQQRVEILKALYRDVQVLILDEPTSVLTPYETEGLFVVMEQMAREGFGVVFISHKLDEVICISHRITVLRDGKVVETLDTPDASPDHVAASRSTLARLMVGRDVVFRLEKPDMVPGAVLLETEALCAENDAGMPALRNVSLRLRRGEILGVAGVAGNGQSELAEVLTGLRPIISGRVSLGGESINGLAPKQIIDRGVGFIPEKVRQMAVLPSFSIEANAILKVHDQAAFQRAGFLREGAIAVWAEGLMKAFDIRAPSRHVAVEKLSGGNLHKLVLASELGRDPHLVIAANPTAGLDVGATEYIRRRLIGERERGKAVLLISSELEEVMALSDRIAVMYQGRIAGVVTPDQATAETMGLLMAGAQPEGSAHLSDIALTDGNGPGAQAGWAPDTLVPAMDVPVTKNWWQRLKPQQFLQLISDRSGWASVLGAVIAVALALLLVGVLIALMGVSPVEAYRALWRSALGTRNGFGETLIRTTPLLLTGLAVLVAFRCGIWNIGAEGQLYMGALGAALVGILSDSLPTVIHLPLVMAAGFVFGAAYGALPGLMRAYRGANEIITTIMLNYVAIFIVSYLVTGPMRDPGLLLPQPQSPNIADAARLSKIISGTRAHSGIFIALVAAFLIFILLWKTVSGYRIQAVGENPDAARFGGINVPHNIVLAMAISGGLAGLAGMVEVAGVRGYLIDNLSPGYGYTAIAVALLGGLHPAGVTLAAFFFAALLAGADGLQRSVGVPTATVLIIQGLVLVFVIGRSAVRWRRQGTVE